MKYISVIFLLVLVACNLKNDSGNFEKRIPVDNHGNFELSYRYIQAETNYAKLIKIENGFDSLVIRIWYSSNISTNHQVIEFNKVENNEWTGNIYSLIVDTENITKFYSNGRAPNIGNYYDIDTAVTMYKINNKAKLIPPLNGWSLFSQELFKNGIVSLPDFRIIDGYNPQNSHSVNIVIEIATKKFYRIYSYPSPELNLNKKPVERLAKILNLIKDEFRVDPFSATILINHPIEDTLYLKQDSK